MKKKYAQCCEIYTAGKEEKEKKSMKKMCVWLAKYPVTIRRRHKFYNCQVKWIGIETFSRMYLESLEKTFHRKHLVETDFVCYLSISVCNVKSYKKQRSRKEVIKIKQGASRVCNALLAQKKCNQIFMLKIEGNRFHVEYESNPVLS